MITDTITILEFGDTGDYFQPLLRFFDLDTLQGQAPIINKRATWKPGREVRITHCTLLHANGEHRFEPFKPLVRMRAGDTLTVDLPNLTINGI